MSKDVGKKCVTEVFSRVTGFFRPVQDWNKGKAAEFKQRKMFQLGGKVENEQRSSENRENRENK